MFIFTFKKVELGKIIRLIKFENNNIGGLEFNKFCFLCVAI